MDHRDEIPLRLGKPCIKCGKDVFNAELMAETLCSKHAVEALLGRRSEMPEALKELVDQGLEILAVGSEGKEIDFTAVETLVALMLTCEAAGVDFNKYYSSAEREFLYLLSDWQRMARLSPEEIQQRTARHEALMEFLEKKKNAEH
jgi:hypothetical protein